MELIIKIYSDKPSRIGVKYTYDYQAQKAYEEVIRKGGSGSYKLSLEPVRDKITLVATSLDSGIKITYKDLEYKRDQLLKLQAVFHSLEELWFVHVYPKNNVLLVAKPFKMENFVKIVSFEMINL
jgi:hypothetical protein